MGDVRRIDFPLTAKTVTEPPATSGHIDVLSTREISAYSEQPGNNSENTQHGCKEKYMNDEQNELGTDYRITRNAPIVITEADLDEMEKRGECFTTSANPTDAEKDAFFEFMERTTEKNFVPTHVWDGYSTDDKETIK